jgi:uncharacterized protein YqeY
MSKSTVVTQVAAALANGFASVEGSANIMEAICKTVATAYKGKEIPSEDQTAIVERMVQERGDAWQESTAASRKTDARRVLETYTTLPEAISIVRKDGPCSWRDAMALARLLVKHEGNVKDAVKGFTAESSPKKKNPSGKVAGALKAWFKVAKGDKRADIIKAATILGLQIEGVNK